MSEIFCCPNCATGGPKEQDKLKKLKKSRTVEIYGLRDFFVGKCNDCGIYFLVEDDHEGEDGDDDG